MPIVEGSFEEAALELRSILTGSDFKAQLLAFADDAVPLPEFVQCDLSLFVRDIFPSCEIEWIISEKRSLDEGLDPDCDDEDISSFDVHSFRIDIAISHQTLTGTETDDAIMLYRACSRYIEAVRAALLTSINWNHKYISSSLIQTGVDQNNESILLRRFEILIESTEI